MPRKSHFTRAGKEALRRHCLKNKPWLLSTGPRTPQGKAKVRMNAWKHGNRSREGIARKYESYILGLFLSAVVNCHVKRAQENATLLLRLGKNPFGDCFLQEFARAPRPLTAEERRKCLAVLMNEIQGAHVENLLRFARIAVAMDGVDMGIRPRRRFPVVNKPIKTDPDAHPIDQLRIAIEAQRNQ